MDIHQRILKMRAGQRVQRPNGSSSSSTFGSMASARNADAPLHAAGDFEGACPACAIWTRSEIVHRPVVALGGDFAGKHLCPRPAGRCRRPTATAAANGSGTRRRGPDRANSPPCLPAARRRRSPASARDQIEHRRLAAAGMADDRNELALADRQSMSRRTSLFTPRRSKVLPMRPSRR